MKRLKIWISSFSLVQQYLVAAFLGVLLLALFTFEYLNNNINNFINQEMFNYLHRSQSLYISSIVNNTSFDDTNVYNYYFDSHGNLYIKDISLEALDLIEGINPVISEQQKDFIYEKDDKIITYSISKLGRNYVVSIMKDEYRNGYRSSLLSGIIDSSVFAITIVFVLIMIWVYSLIYPLNSIRNYIQKVRKGEKATLNIKRNDEIGEVAEAVTTMHDELSKQQRIREEMIQNISHDLKTPIATIKSYSESIKDGIYPYDTLEKSVDVIIEHADRLEKKVYSLISLNKIDYLEDNETTDNVLMHTVIEKAILSCGILRNDVEIDTSEVEHDVYFHGNEDAWRTVVENLLDNSLRYAKSKIKFMLSKDLFEIFNDGELMSKERIEKLFKPYEKGTKGKFGLGLSIVKKVCDTYGYMVCGENKDNGVVFRIYRNKIKQKKNKV